MKYLGAVLISALLCPAGAVSAADPFPASAQVLDNEQLEEARGAEGNVSIVTSDQDFNASVDDTRVTAGALNTGSVSLAEGAFSGFSGVGVNVLNTGNANSFSTGVSMSVHLH
jgi:hypothetical protein